VSGNVELRHLRAFVAVAEELNFSRAAKRLHLVQQSLSSQVRQLEDELGVQLLRRTTRRVELSEAGHVLLGHARPILAEVATACAEARRAGTGEAGELAIAYTPTLAAEALPRMVDEVHRRYPGLHLQLCEMWQAEAVAAVTGSRFDVGLARCPVDLGDLECVAIRDEPMGIVLGSGHPLAAGDRVVLDDIAHTTLAIWPRSLSPGFFDLVVGFFRAEGFVGAIQEFEYLTSDVFHGDPGARREIAEARAFSVAFATQFDPIPPGFVWRAVDPCPLIPVDLFWRPTAGPAALNFVRLALEVAAREGWLTPDRANGILTW
jgi:DNA-binding transcriptional LysR family regulator